jgi:hypothetical protein
MNNGNDMVGWSGSPNSLSGSPNTYAGGPIQAFLWNSSQGIVGLGFLAGCTNSQANSINDSNQIVGICFNWDPINTENSNTAFIWTSGAGMAQLVSSNIGGTNSGANAISAGGIAVGSSQIGGTNQAVAWAPGQNAVVLNTLVTNLNVDGWTNITEAGGINSYGMIVGDGLKTNGVRHAFILYPAAAPAGQCVPPPSGMVGWWPGDGNANDISGNGLNGVLMNGTSFAPGVVGQAFNFDGVSNYVQVATTDSLNPVQGQGWTVEGWIRPATNIGEMPIAQKGNEMGTTDPYDYGRQYWTFGTDESKLIFEVGHTGYNVESMISSNGIALNQWSHVAVVVTNIGGPGDSYTFYINGTNAGTQIAIEGSVASITTTEPLRIGAAKDWNDIVSYHFQGQIDELAIYNRALSASEIAAIYSAGSAGKCKPLEMITQPQSQTGFWGGNVTLSVTASSISPPLYYQWLQNGVPIANATNATLVLNNLQSTNAGSYTVVVTDSAGNAMTSNPANLTVNAAVVSIALYAGVTISGVVGQTYGIQSTINLNNTNSWAGMTNITLSTPSQIWYDAQPANQSQCFYRVVAGPISIP